MAKSKEFICPDCGQSVLKLWDHGCPGVTFKPPERHLTPKEQQIMHAARRKSVKTVPEPTPLVEPKKKAATPAERFKKWHGENKEKWNAYMRDYMSRRRKKS